MKKSHLATAIKAASVLALTACSASAFAEPKISGRLYLSGLYQDKDVTTTDLTTNTSTTTSTSRPTMESASSRLRFTGDETLTEAVKLEYWLEYGVKVDDESPVWNARNQYLGFVHKDYGTLRFGRMFTPDDDIDYVDATYLFADSAGHAFSYSGQRTNNTIRYISPKINDKTEVKLQYSMDEGAGSNSLAVASVLHEANDKLTAGASYSQGYINGTKDVKALRAMAEIKPVDKLTVGVMGQYMDYNTSYDEMGVTVSGVYKFQPTLDGYAQVSHAQNYKGWSDGESTKFNVGAVKWLKNDGSTRVRLFGALGYADTTELGSTGTSKVQTESFSAETGIRYDF